MPVSPTHLNLATLACALPERRMRVSVLRGLREAPSGDWRSGTRYCAGARQKAISAAMGR